jgi:hypothetical protein
MPEVAPASAAHNFGTNHAIGTVCVQFYSRRIDGIVKAWPSTVAVELCIGCKKDLTAACAPIAAILMMVPVLAGARALCAFLSQYVVLLRG